MQISLPVHAGALRSESAANARPAYRGDIEGLRGLAVGLVVAYHAFPEYRTGGFIGVDVFFVISGYLITQLILSDLRAGTFSIGEFYRRRVRRIVPALLLVTAACCIVGLLVMLPSELEWLGKSVSYSTSFLANLFFVRTGTYFAPAAVLNPLLHLWSLGVEEQFYLAWPLLLMLTARHGVTLRVLAGVLATSLAISIWGAWYAPTPHFYYPTSRAWELAAGGLLAAWHRYVPREPVAESAWSCYERPFVARALSLAGLALIVTAGVCWTVDDPIPGLWSVLPTAGAVMLIAVGPQAPVNRWLLGTLPLTFVGRVSYPLYLWHWPLLSFTRIIIGRSPGPALAAAEMAVAFIAAYATHRLVEAPIRFGTSGRRAVPGLLAGLAALALIGAAVGLHRIPGRLSGPLIGKWDAAVNDWYFPANTNFDPRSGLGTVTVTSHRARKVLFIGDSHIQQYWPRIKYIIDTRPNSSRSAVFVTYYGCPPLPGISGAWRHSSCSRYFDFAVEQSSRPGVDTIVFGAYWERYFLGEYGEEGRSQQATAEPRADARAPLALDSPATRQAFQRFHDMVEHMVASGQRVFIVLSNPTSPLFKPLLAPEIRLSLPIPKDLAFNRARRFDVGPFETFVAPLTDRLRGIAAQTGARVLDPRSTLCDQMMCPAADPEGIPFYLDSNHLNGHGARQRASFLDETLLWPDTPSRAVVSVDTTNMPFLKE